MNESIMENTMFVDRIYGLVSLEAGDKIRRIKMRETSFLSANGKFLDYLKNWKKLKNNEQVKAESNSSMNNVTIKGSLSVSMPIEKLSEKVNFVPINGQYYLIDFHPIKLRATMIKNARANGFSAYNTFFSNDNVSVDSNDMFNVGVEANIPMESDVDSVTSAETENDSMSVIDNNAISDVREPIEVVPSRADSESYANDIDSAFKDEKNKNNTISIEPNDNSSKEVEPVTISPADVKATVGSGAKLDVGEQEVTSISSEEVKDVVFEKHRYSTDEAVEKKLKSLELSVSKNSTHPAKISSFDDEGNYLNNIGVEDDESKQTTSMVEQPVVFRKVQFNAPKVHVEISKVPVVAKVELDKVFTPVSNEKLEENFKKAISSNNEKVENNVVNDSKNIREDIVVVPDRPVTLNKKENKVVASDDIEDFVVVEGDLSNGLQEESKASYDELTSVTDEFSTKQDVMSDNNSDLNVINEDLSTGENDFKVHFVNDNYSEPSSDFNKNISKNCDNAVDSKYDKSALEKLKNNITILQDKLKAKKEDLKSTKIQNDAANIELKTAREEIENVFKNLFNYSQELENSAAMIDQQKDEIERQTKDTLDEVDKYHRIVREASSVLPSTNEEEYSGGMRRAA